MSDKADIPIRVFASPAKYASRDLRDEPRIAQVIRDRILPQTQAEYFRVDVKVKRKRDQAPRQLIAYLLRKDIYKAEVVKLDVDPNFQVSGITFDYDESQEAQEDDETEESAFAQQPDYEEMLDFVAATPVPEIPTAKAAIEKAHSLATEAGLRSKILLGADATVANYQKYLASGLKGFLNVGHGNTSMIHLSDGPLSYSWFNSLANQPLKPAVVYFNSCQVFNDPLKAAVIQAAARTYIGGIVNLLIGPSEEVCKCFWSKALLSSTPMGDALRDCERANYPNQGAHGIAGDLGAFRIENLRLAHAMWVPAHNLCVQHPDRLTQHVPYGFFTQIQGKPFTSNWLHLSIPTPVIVDSQRLRVGSVMIRFRVGPGTSVHAVHVYDGENRIAAHDNLNLAPQGSFACPRFDVPIHPDIKWGLGISIGVKFGDGVNLPPNKLLLEICSAGCDFMLKAPYAGEPEPTNGHVEIEAIPEERVAAAVVPMLGTRPRIGAERLGLDLPQR